jgi:guanylate cyclase
MIPGMARWSALGRLVTIADDAIDDDETRRRKRAGVIASLTTVVVPLLLPLQAPSLPIAWPLAIGLSAFSVANLAILARTRRFDRFVTLLLLTGVVFVPGAAYVGGGILGPTDGLVWAFLLPAYAILALGPHRAVRWFAAYLATIVALVALDPFAREAAPPAPYPLVVLGHVQNSVVPLTIVFLLFRYTDLRRIAAEQRVDELLTNAIPPTIASRLRRGERRIAEAYAATSVVFADLVGFTSWAHRSSPSELVAVLDELFTAFDELAAGHGLEKVKTIGDAYMAVAGAPEPRADHAAAAVAFGGDVVEAVADLRERRGIALEVRVGIASGSVVGGVIGTRRLLFDLWGDTVNLAQRMEASGVPGRVQITASTRDLLHAPESAFERRTVEAKGLGAVDAFLVADLPKRSP